MNFYTRKKIIHKIFLLLFVSLGFNAFGQNAVLVREAVQDSSEYFGNLKNVNDELFYTGGEIRPPRNVGFCGNGGPRDFREAHIYKYDAKQDESKKLFHHDLENFYASRRMQKLDSSMLYNRRIFIPFSDSSGVFLQHSTRAIDYWVKSGDNYERVILPDGRKMSHNYDWFEGKLLVNVTDPSFAEKLWYIDAANGFQIKPFLNDTLTYGAKIVDIYNEHIIFGGFSYKYDSDFALFVLGKNGTINQLGSYPWGTTMPKYIGVFKGKVMFTLTGRGFKGNYTEKHFISTELWEYDIQSNISKKVYDFGEYGSVASAYEYNNDLYFTFGKLVLDSWEQKMYKLSKGNVIKNDKPSTLNDMNSYPELTDFNNEKYFIGADNEDVKRLYTINKNNRIKPISKKYPHVRRFHMIGNRLIFTTNENVDENCLKFYQITEGSGKIEQITDICLVSNYRDYQRYKIFMVGNDVYFAFRYDTEPKREKYQTTETGDILAYADPYYEKRELPQIDLFRLEGSKLKLVKADIKSVKFYLMHEDFIDMAIIKDDLYIVSRANKKDPFNQLWKITNETN